MRFCKKKEILKYKTITNKYYFVKWKISLKELYISSFALIVLNFLCYYVIKVQKKYNIGIAFSICFITDFIEIVLMYLAFKVPYVRWRRIEKNRNECKDITNIQNQYAKKIIRLYYIILLLAYCGVIFNGFIMMVQE